MRERARVQLIGEVTGVGRSKVQAYFELRDGEGAVPCAIWLNDLEKAGLSEGGLRDGAEVVISGGLDYYPGGGQASPNFCFRATHVRLAGEGDLIARLEALRKQLRAEGLFELQKQLHRPGPAEGDRRRHRGDAARRGATCSPALRAARLGRDRRLGLRAGAGPPRGAGDRAGAAGPGGAAGGGGDRGHPRRRQPRRPLGLLRRDPLPHRGDAAGAGDQRRRPRARQDPDRRRRRGRLLDPDPRGRGGGAARLPRRAREPRALRGRRCGGRGRGRSGRRSRHLGALARGPARALQRERGKLNQKIREIRAASERGLAERAASQRRIGTVVLERARRRAVGADMEKRRGGAAPGRGRRCAPTNPSARWSAATPWSRARAGEPLTSAAEAGAAERISLRFSDGRVRARPEPDDAA